MLLQDFEPILGPAGLLTLAVGPLGRQDINDLNEAIFSVYNFTRIIGLTRFPGASSTGPSGLPLTIHRSIDQTMQKLRLLLLERPSNGHNNSRISQGDKAKLFELLATVLDAVRELYDHTDPFRQFGGIEYGTIWAKMETRFVMDEVRELLYSIAGSDSQGQPAYPPYSPITSSNGIRLVVIHPDVNPESVIRCSVIYEEDYSKRAYAALSYVWGEPTNPQPTILLHGTPYPVRPNLYAALKHFRHASRRRVLWIDNVCIDQGNEGEKNHQISLMDKIYSSSVCVLMWIGDGGSNSRFAVQWLRELQDARTQDLRAFHEAQRLGTGEDEYRPRYLDKVCHNDTFRNHWPAIRAFFHMPYWRRVWILQEAIAKKESLICYGAYGVPWSFVCHLARASIGDMQEAIAFKVGEDKLPDADGVSIELGIAFRYIESHADFTDMREHRQPIPFLHALLASRNCKATDRRDHIYAVRGFVSDCPVTIDCSKHVYQVYLETARDVILQTSRLDFLTACKGWSPERRKWEIEAFLDQGGFDENQFRALIRRYLPPQTTLETMTADQLAPLLRVARNPPFQLPEGDEYRKEFIDLFERLGTACLPSWVPQWHWSATEPYLLLDWRDQPKYLAVGGTRRFNASGGTTARCIFRNGDTALSLSAVQADIVRSRRVPVTASDNLRNAWEWWMQGNPTTPLYPTRESRQDAYYRTCMRVSVADSEDRRVWSNRSGDVSWIAFKLSMGWGDLSERAQAAFDMMNSYGAQGAEFVERTSRNTNNQAFFTCQGGRIGLGPLAMQTGDLVCVLKGGDVPFILRRVSGGCYYLIGEAFVDGIMNGEAMTSGHRQVNFSEFTLV